MPKHSKRRRTYHHGDLRAALITAALRRIDAGEPAEFGLRDIAADTGVSVSAVYRHFADKTTLLEAVAQEGLRRLAAVQVEAAQRADAKSAGFVATGQAYVRFAIANPALFRLIFSRRPLASADWAKMDDDASRLLFSNAAALLDNPDPDTLRRYALRAWALVHGLAMLLLEGRIPSDFEAIDAVIAAHDSQIASGRPWTLRPRQQTR